MFSYRQFPIKRKISILLTLVSSGHSYQSIASHSRESFYLTPKVWTKGYKQDRYITSQSFSLVKIMYRLVAFARKNFFASLFFFEVISTDGAGAVGELKGVRQSTINSSLSSSAVSPRSNPHLRTSLTEEDISDSSTSFRSMPVSHVDTPLSNKAPTGNPTSVIPPSEATTGNMEPTSGQPVDLFAEVEAHAPLRMQQANLSLYALGRNRNLQSAGALSPRRSSNPSGIVTDKASTTTAVTRPSFSVARLQELAAMQARPHRNDILERQRKRAQAEEEADEEDLANFLSERNKSAFIEKKPY
ncbi:hypothetical protein CPC08DRAFT_708039 [Agrocybe pediades]|nr:hypothetical protein CPC08DRAFT_708039 [Agrocybe pediades]